jgi:hypothetical protein
MILIALRRMTWTSKENCRLYNVDKLSKAAGVSAELIAAEDVFLLIRGLQSNEESKWYRFE